MHFRTTLPTPHPLSPRIVRAQNHSSPPPQGRKGGSKQSQSTHCVSEVLHTPDLMSPSHNNPFPVLLSNTCNHIFQIKYTNTLESKSIFFILTSSLPRIRPHHPSHRKSHLTGAASEFSPDYFSSVTSGVIRFKHKSGPLPSSETRPGSLLPAVYRSVRNRTHPARRIIQERALGQ